MIPISDDNPTLRTPVVTYTILVILFVVWLFVQGAGFDPRQLSVSVCELGLVTSELTGRAEAGQVVPIGEGLSCVLQPDALRWLTPFTSMFLHGSWLHLLGNALFFWVFGNNVEDSMGRLRFVAFYLLCGLAAAGAQMAANPGAVVPMVGASGAISGVMGAYLVLYPKVRVNMLFIFVILLRIIPVPAWMVLLWWFGLQLLQAAPDLMGAGREVSSGVAFTAHVGGFLAGLVLVKPFENKRLMKRRHDKPRRPRPRRFYRSWP